MKERNYGIDLLRIVLAFMVITIHIHANGTGQVLLYSTTQPWKALATFVTFLCYPAVNTYILITGYYSYKAKKELNGVIISLSRLWLSALFFSLFGYAISIASGNAFNPLDLIKIFFPITRGVWWFYTVYFALMLLSPFFNKMLDSINVGGHRMLLAIMLLMLSILPMFVNWEGQLGSNYGYSLIWFIALYVTGAYLQRIKFLDTQNIKKFLVSSEFFVAATISIYIVPKFFSIIGISINLAMYNSVCVYIQAIALFISFGNIRLSKGMAKIVGSISGLALASYLLHCQEDIEKLLWPGVNPAAYANSARIIYVTIVICITVFIIGVLLESAWEYICRVLKIDKNFAEATGKGYVVIERLLRDRGE